MKKFGLEEKYINYILETLNKYFTNTEYYIFGSRSTGKFRKYSDVDIALQANKQINDEILTKIKLEFENSTFPYEVDIIDLNNITERFYSCIKDDLIQI